MNPRSVSESNVFRNVSRLQGKVERKLVKCWEPANIEIACPTTSSLKAVTDFICDDLHVDTTPWRYYMCLSEFSFDFSTWIFLAYHSKSGIGACIDENDLYRCVWNDVFLSVLKLSISNSAVQLITVKHFRLYWEWQGLSYDGHN